MGIIGAVKTYCIANHQDDKLATFLDNNGKIINDDYTYFQQQNWFRLQAVTLFDPNKFIFLYTHYKQRQQKLCTQWKIVDTKKFKNTEKIIFCDQPLQPKWVFAIRRGVPIKYYKNIIEMLFAKNFNLEQSSKKYQTLFYEYYRKNGNKMELVTFQEQSVQNTFSTSYLNKEGMEAAKRITFLLSRTHSQLQYNIYIVNIISLLLIFVPQADTYEIVSTMIDGSTSMPLQRQQSLRWHISLTNNQFQKFSRQFFKTVKDISPSIRVINQHLNTEGIDKFQVFRQIVGQFFIGFLPFHIVLQIFIMYLNEGVKIFYRFFYAILKMTGQVIRESSSTKQIIRVIRTKLLTTLNNQKQIKQFFRYAFDLQLQNLLIQKAEIQLKKRISKKEFNIVYYLPEIVGESQILSFLDVQAIWAFLPKFIKHYDARKIFSTKENGTNLKNMLSCLQENVVTMIIVQTATQQVFGVFIADKLKSQDQIRLTLSKTSSQVDMYASNPDRKIKHSLSSNALISAKYFGSSQTFVFILSPTCKKFPATGQNVYYCSYSEDNFTIGGLQPALQLGPTLTQGLSYNSPTYNNEPLNGCPGEFRIKLIQCFSIE